MQNITLYKQFDKKENSTKLPGSGTASLSLQGILKEPCSVFTPVITIERLASDALPAEYTYAKWVEADRYYFIEDWVWVNGLWEVHLKEDVLATFKTEIGSCTEYVLRHDSSQDYNGLIADTTYPTTNEIVTETVEGLNAFTNDLTVGCYIVGIISGGNTNAVGAISYYAMDSTQFGALKQELFSNDNLELMGIIDSQGVSISDVSQEVLKTLYNPYQYIASCMWFPFPVTAILSKTSVTGIKIGWWEYATLTGYSLYAQTLTIAEQPFQFTEHPQAATRGQYLNYAPYSRRTLIGRFGTVAIDSASYAAGDGIGVSYQIDLITGQCRAFIERLRTVESTLTVDVLGERQFLLAVPIQIAQVGTDYLGTAASAIGAVTGSISGFLTGNIAGAINTAASGIYNTIQAAMPQVETSGSNGSFLSSDFPTKYITQFYKIVDEDIAHRGRPLCELRQLNTLSGFILCAEGEIDISCYDNERKEIQNYLTTGFFME